MVQKYKILSTFTGCGGLDIGFHGGFDFLGKPFSKLPFETVFAIDNNSHACETLKNDIKYFNNTEVKCADITDYNFNNIN